MMLALKHGSTQTFGTLLVKERGLTNPCWEDAT